MLLLECLANVDGWETKFYMQIFDHKRISTRSSAIEGFGGWSSKVVIYFRPDSSDDLLVTS